MKKYKNLEEISKSDVDDKKLQKAIERCKNEIRFELALKFLTQKFSDIEKNNQQVICVAMPQKEYDIFRQFDGVDKVFDAEYNIDILKRGTKGFLWGAKVVVDKKAKEIYCIGCKSKNKLSKLYE